MSKERKKTQQKAKKTNQKPLVKIRKLKTNYNLTFDYDKCLQAYIKSLPREHKRVFKEDVVMLDGTIVPTWVSQIREVQIGNIISFLLDNSYPFSLENFTEDEMNRLRSLYLERQKRIRSILKAKADSIAIDDTDWSFMKIIPYDYQKQAVKFAEMTDGNMMLGDEPGVGKTAVGFSYAAKHKLKTLVICPASLKLNWKNEIEKFTHEKAFVYKYKPTKKSGKVNHSKEESLFHIINFESIQSFIKLKYKHTCKGNLHTKNGMKTCGCVIESLRKKITEECPECANKNTFKTRTIGLEYIIDNDDIFLNPDDYDLLIIDEFHRIKERTTDWTKIIELAFGETIPKKMLLSGTAIKSRPMELYMPLRLLDKQTWNSAHDYGIKYCAGFEDNFGWKYDGASNLEELYQRISSFYLRRLKRDVLSQLPPKTYTEINIEMDSKVKKQYKDFEDEMITVINELGNEEEQEMSFLAKVHLLKKCTETYKLEKAREFIDDIISSNDKVVLFFDYIDTGHRIKELWGDKAVLHTGQMSSQDKQNSVEQFQNKKNINVFGGTFGSAGVGITLTKANKLIMLGQPWTPADRSQAEDRIHRASTTHDNVQIITFLVEDTVDTIIYELLQEKSQVVSKLLDNIDFKHKAHKADEKIISRLLEIMKS